MEHSPSPSELSLGSALRLCKETTDIDVIIDLTKHENARVRKTALVEMCPCRVKKDLSDFWARVLEMADDSDPLVRKQVLHTLCDGSPAHLEVQVVEMLEIFNKDKDSDIRRTAHKVLGHYWKSGKWNIL
uniref:Uncharacterized protein LOC111104616 n=1 Tax=Crassostrea virginica TaxID=6565 RepID=A0A8B8AWA9_CRAVI|nr:uncharacterized protein LOC111104616 [Crassostrea virginica]XP_022294564.1 uncharacterized protein LOC111104751 [Crassostrea virginica]